MVESQPKQHIKKFAYEVTKAKADFEHELMTTQKAVDVILVDAGFYARRPQWPPGQPQVEWNMVRHRASTSSAWSARKQSRRP